MIRGLDLLCQGNNSRIALENLAKAKDEASCNGTDSQAFRLEKYELIVSCIVDSETKENLTLEEIAQVTGLPLNYIKSHMYSISLYAFTKKQIENAHSGRGKYANNGHSDHSVPMASLPRKINRCVREI